MIQVTVLKFFCDPLLLVLLGRKGLCAVVTVPMRVLERTEMVLARNSQPMPGRQTGCIPHCKSMQFLVLSFIYCTSNRRLHTFISSLITVILSWKTFTCQVFDSSQLSTVQGPLLFISLLLK